MLGYNYHDAKPLGVSVCSKNKAYYIPFDLLIKSKIFLDNKKKYTYNLKKMLVIFDKYDIKIDKNIRDLMIEGYLLNKNIKNDISYLANQYEYDIMFYDKEFGIEITIHETDFDTLVNNAIKKAQFIFNKQNEFYEELKKEEMTSLYNEIELPLVMMLA